MINSAIITPILAAGSTDSPYFFQVNLTQKLCSPTCVDLIPVFNPVYSLVGYSSVGTSQYMATINVQGVISYIPCNGNSCCTKSQVVSQNFSIPFYSTAAVTSVSVSSGTPVNTVVGSACQRCSKTFVSETPIELTVS